MTVVAQSSVAQKIIRPYVFRPTGFSPNRLHSFAYKSETASVVKGHQLFLWEMFVSDATFFLVLLIFFMQESGEQLESMSSKDAAMFPVFASVTLFGLYMFFQVLTVYTFCLSNIPGSNTNLVP